MSECVCPTCGNRHQTREWLTDREIEAMRDLEDRYPGFRFSMKRHEAGDIDSSYDGKPMVSNRTVKQVAEMLRAMSEGRRP